MISVRLNLLSRYIKEIAYTIWSSTFKKYVQKKLTNGKMMI